jgi:hypothetical protein
MLSSDINNIRHATYIALLVISVAAIPIFIWWMNRQVKHSRPAVMPNALWRNASFTSVCVMVMLSNAVGNNMELFCSLL